MIAPLVGSSGGIPIGSSGGNELGQTAKAVDRSWPRVGGYEDVKRPLLTTSDAVGRFVHDEMTVYLGNFGAQLFAVAHELIRQGKRNLRVVVSSGGILLDQLIGAGVVREAVFAHCWNPVGPAPTWNFRRAAEGSGRKVHLVELSLGALNSSLMAAAWGVPFMPTTPLAHTGYVKEGWSGRLIGTVEWEDEICSIVRAVTPDVAFIHADLVDELGNAVINGPLGEVAVAAQAARTVVVVAEELAPAIVRSSSRRVAVPGILTEAIVIEPNALHPDGAPGRYGRDTAFYEQYALVSRTESGFAAWIGEWVAGVPDRASYYERISAGATVGS